MTQNMSRMQAPQLSSAMKPQRVRNPRSGNLTVWFQPQNKRSRVMMPLASLKIARYNANANSGWKRRRAPPRGCRRPTSGGFSRRARSIRLTTPSLTSPFNLEMWGTNLDEGRGSSCADVDNLASWLDPFGSMVEEMREDDTPGGTSPPPHSGPGNGDEGQGLV